jgi:hypothetical protein
MASSIHALVDTPETHSNEPMPPGAASGDEAHALHEMVRKVGRLPDGVQRVDFHFGQDSEGAPAVWITFVATTSSHRKRRSLNCSDHE